MRLENKQRKPAVRVLAAALAVTLFGGLIAASANDTIQPRLIEGSVFPSNDPPKAPSMVERGFARVAMDGDASVKFTTTGVGGQIVYYHPSGRIENTSLQPTTDCPGAGGGTINTPGVAYGGDTIIFQSNAPHISCLLGREAAADVNSFITWVGEKKTDGWEFTALSSHISNSTTRQLAAPAASGDGRQVYFASFSDLTGKGLSSAPRVYQYDLDAKTFKLISSALKTGAGQDIGYLIDSKILVSQDGKYVGWENEGAVQTGRMLSDEAGNAVNNIILAKVKSDGGDLLSEEAIRMTAVAAPDPAALQSKRKGRLLGIMSGSGESSPKAFYSMNSDRQGYAYDLKTGGLYDLGIKLSDVSVDGKGGAYAAGGDTTISAYNLGSDPGLTPISQSVLTRQISTSSTYDNFIFATANGRTVLSAYRGSSNSSSTIEYPLP